MGLLHQIRQGVPSAITASPASNNEVTASLKARIAELEAENAALRNAVHNVHTSTSAQVDMSTQKNVDRPKRDWAAIKRRQRIKAKAAS